MKINIRTFQPSDIDTLMDFWTEIENDPTVSGDFFSPTEENKSRWRKYVLNVHEEDENQILVAEHEEKIIGFIKFITLENRALESDIKCSLLSLMYVVPEFRRKRIASELMNRVFEYVKSKGVTHVRLNVLTSNIPAMNLYKKMGFQDYSIIMRKKLK